MQRQPNTQYILSYSYGKDSTACLRAIELLGWPLDRIVTADIWATDTIPADLPEVWEFKKMADQRIYDMYGIRVEHYCAVNRSQSVKVEREREKESQTTYEQIFYRKIQNTGKEERRGRIYGWPIVLGAWCNSKLKVAGIKESEKHFGDSCSNIVRYIGIAADEPIRIARHKDKLGIRMPLVEIGWDEDLCGLEATYMGLFSPTYENSFRDGCWFCHNQSIDQLRRLRKVYPDLWALMLKWDADSPVSFHPDGHTVHDFDRRFAMEDSGRLPTNRRFRWSMLEESEQLSLF